jgi:hypothetical protein
MLTEQPVVFEATMFTATFGQQLLARYLLVNKSHGTEWIGTPWL